MADPVQVNMADCEISFEEIQNLKVTDLRKKLKALGLPITGNKTELIERLQEVYLSNKGNDSFENSQLSYDDQMNELEGDEDNDVLEEERILLDQNQLPSYLSPSLSDNSKLLGNVENKSSSNSVIMPPKKRTFSKAEDTETAERKLLLNRTNATDVVFEIETHDTQSKHVPVILNEKSNSDEKSGSDEKFNSDEKVKLSLKSMSATERLAMRAKRFNTNGSGVDTSTSVKSIKITNSRNSKQSILSSATKPDLDVLKKRAERFGQCVSSVMKQIEHKEKLLKRKSKFGANLAVSSVSSVDEQAKKKQRAERFGIL